MVNHWWQVPLHVTSRGLTTSPIPFYDDIRSADSPQQLLLDFLQSTYDAGAKLANWDRDALER
jgi:hypothetical protein